MYDELVKRLHQRIALTHAGSPLQDDLQEAADAIEELSKPRWIPATERLPEYGQEVLCACKAGIYEVFKYVDGISGPWYKDSRHVYMKGFVTHWMPLPQPPKEE